MNNKDRLRQFLSEFKQKYPMTIGWRLEKNSRVILDHLHDDEEIVYAFYGQKNANPLNILGTCVVAITNERLIIGRDRVVIGYFFDSITPDMFNDLKVKSGIIWGKIEIDTVKEFVVLSNLDKRSLIEIEKNISEHMNDMKKEFEIVSNKRMM